MTLYDWLKVCVQGVHGGGSQRRSVWRRVPDFTGCEVQRLEDRAMLTGSPAEQSPAEQSLVGQSAAVLSELHQSSRDVSSGVQTVPLFSGFSSDDAMGSDGASAGRTVDVSFLVGMGQPVLSTFDPGAVPEDANPSDLDGRVADGRVADWGIDFAGVDDAGDVAEDQVDSGGVNGGIDDWGVDLTGDVAGDAAGDQGDMGGIHGGIDDWGVDFTGDFSGDVAGDQGDAGGVYGGIDDWGVDFTGDVAGDHGDSGGVYGGIDDYGVDDYGAGVDGAGDYGVDDFGADDYGADDYGADDYGVDFSGVDGGFDAGGDDGGGVGVDGETAGDTGGDDLGARPVVSLRVADSQAWEGPYRDIQEDRASFAVRQTGFSPLDVKIQFSGQAVPGADYVIEINGVDQTMSLDDQILTLSLPGGTAEQFVLIRTLMDHEFEYHELVVVTVLSDFAYRLTAPATGQMVIVDRTADLDITTGYGAKGLLNEWMENFPGADLKLNVDHDNRKDAPDMELYYDGMTSQVVGSEDDFVYLRITDHIVRPYDTEISGNYEFSLQFHPQVVRVWWADISETIPVWHLIPAGEKLPRHVRNLFVEGVGPGETSLALVWHSAAVWVKPHVMDTVLVTVWHADLDIDSDNSNGLESPDRSNWEDELEDNEYGIGKLIYPTPLHLLQPMRQKFTPLVFDFSLNRSHPDQLGIALEYRKHGQSGGVQVWTVPSEYPGKLNPWPFEDGGHLITPGRTYSLSELVQSGRFHGFWLQAEYVQKGHETKRAVATYGKPLDRIIMHLQVNRGAGWRQFAYDTVQYMVVAEDTFYPNLQWSLHATTGVVLRDALASEGVYEKADLPRYAMQRLGRKEMELLEIPDDVIRKLLNSGVWGFKASLYRDYVSGEYVLTFAGTDDVWDGLDDLWQGVGLTSRQYLEAMAIAAGLMRIFSDRPPELAMRTTGHSLGGGMASAAAVVTGMKANTFNAAGLNFNTLFKRTTIGIITNEELYPGSVARYFNAERYVTAWYLEYDLLNFLQDHLPALPVYGHIPRAIGVRKKMRGPFDEQLAEDVRQLSARWTELAESAARFSSFAAWLAYLATREPGDFERFFFNTAGKMIYHHTTSYYHFGVMTEREDEKKDPYWDIYGDWALD